MDISEQIKQIKNRMRYLREVTELSMFDMAAKLGISDEQYNEYENGSSDIPAGIIYSAAAILGVDPTELLTGEAPRMADYTVTRKGCGIDVERFPGYSFEALAYNYIERNKDPMLVTIEPSEKIPELVTHGGQEFNYVLEGTVAVIIGERVIKLNEGDCIYFNPSLPHGQYAVGKRSRFLTLIDS
ncbi:MAG TPA: cupin domain-containing protein [Bacillota bacterium]|nr:cupin domain-containing protein [Bacillota bacterium]